MRSLRLLCLCGLSLAGASAPSPGAELDRREVRLHDPSSIVREGDAYWLFATGTGLASWHSRDLRRWEKGPAVWPELPAWIVEIVPEQRGHFWAPDLCRMGDRYYLYYAVSAFGRNTSAIALATNRTLDPAHPAYHWQDEGVVVRSTAADSFNAIDPAVWPADDGRLWLVFGSFWDGIQLLELDPATGRRREAAAPPRTLARAPAIEAPFLYQFGGYYYLFVNHGYCCRGAASTYRIMVGRSRAVTGPYRDRDGRDLADGGGTPVLASAGTFIGPGHAGILRTTAGLWLSCHFYDGSAPGGPGTLALLPLHWDQAGWPRVEAPPSPP